MEGSSASVSNVNKRDPASIFSAASFVVTFILIGLPIWWKTTNVYRVSLPYEEIEDLSQLQISHTVPVTIVLEDRTVQQSVLFEELHVATHDDQNDSEKPRLGIKYAWKMRTVLEEEESAIKQSTDLTKLDKLLHSINQIDEAGVYQVLVLEENKYVAPSTKAVGCHRRGYVSAATGSLVNDIISVVETMIQKDVLKRIYIPPATYERRKPEKDRMKSLSTTTAFDITFSLIIPEPHVLDVHWDIENATEAYIMPFVQSLSLLADVDIKSQVLYMTTLPTKTSLRGEKGEQYLSEEVLPTLINPVEGRLGSYASVKPTLNFVIYIPPQAQTPLHIVDKKGNVLPTNAFLSPQWGGFIIKNVHLPSSRDSMPQKVTLDMQEIMGIFLGQIKLLLGLPDTQTMKNTRIEVMQSSSCCEWELDFLLRKNTQEQLSVAATSLYSLGHLLKTINNIVIRDEVGEQIYFSAYSIKESVTLLREGFLEESFVASKNAFNASESAFFDPSLLALLYFPEDQKYAIYIPLFLPISLPVITSLRQLWTYFRDSRHSKIKEE